MRICISFPLGELPQKQFMKYREDPSQDFYLIEDMRKSRRCQPLFYSPRRTSATSAPAT